MSKSCTQLNWTFGTKLWIDEKHFPHIIVAFELHIVVFNTIITYIYWLTLKRSSKILQPPLASKIVFHKTSSDMSSLIVMTWGSLGNSNIIPSFIWCKHVTITIHKNRYTLHILSNMVKSDKGVELHLTLTAIYIRWSCILPWLIPTTKIAMTI